MPLVVIQSVDDAAGQGNRLDVFLLIVEYTHLPLHGNDGGIEPVELPMLTAVEDGNYAVEPCHALLSPPHHAEHSAHLGLCAQGFGLGIFTLKVAHLHQLL